MKTAKEIILEYGYTSQHVIEKLETCMKKYAEQAIDKCAESAITTEDAYWAGLTDDMILDEVYKQSILDVKNLLK
jgi:hypothetical protein